MKKSILIQILFACTIIFLTGCESSETDNNSINGKLIPGENVSGSDINNITVYLAKLDPEINPNQVNSEIEDAVYIDETCPNADGAFVFNNLEFGNYLTFLSDEYFFENDTIAISTINGQSVNEFTKTVSRYTPDNGLIEVPISINTHNAEFKIKNNTSFENIKLIISNNDTIIEMPVNVLKHVDWNGRIQFPANDENINFKLAVKIGDYYYYSSRMKLPKTLNSSHSTIVKDGQVLTVKLGKYITHYTFIIKYL